MSLLVPTTVLSTLGILHIFINWLVDCSIYLRSYCHLGSRQSGYSQQCYVGESWQPSLSASMKTVCSFLDSNGNSHPLELLFFFFSPTRYNIYYSLNYQGYILLMCLMKKLPPPHFCENKNRLREDLSSRLCFHIIIAKIVL